MSGTYLLDTNAVIAFLNGEEAIQTFIENADEIFVPSIVLGELYFGAQSSGRIEANLKAVEQFAADRIVLVCDGKTARQYGNVRYQLRLKGRPIPENDIWIAAIAMQHNLTLVTRDAHFREMDGLLAQSWSNT